MIEYKDKLRELIEARKTVARLRIRIDGMASLASSLNILPDAVALASGKLEAKVDAVGKYKDELLAHIRSVRIEIAEVAAILDAQIGAVPILVDELRLLRACDEISNAEFDARRAELLKERDERREVLRDLRANIAEIDNELALHN